MDSKLKHLINYILGNFFTKGLAFISIPILTRLLSPKDYGIISLYESLVLILVPIIGLGMSTGISRYYFEEKDSMEDFLRSNIKFLFIYGGVISCILYNFSPVLAMWLELNLKVVKLAILGAALAVAFDIYQRLLMSAKKSRHYNLIGAFKSLVVLTSTIILAYILEEKFYSKIYATLGFGILFVLVFFVKNYEKFDRLKLNLKHIKYSLAYGIPLIPHTLSSFILAQFDRIAISNITGDLGSTGLYSFAYNVGMIQQVIVLSVINALRPYFYNYLNEESYSKINEMGRKYSKFIYISALGLILFSKEIVLIMAKKNYYEALGLVPIIVIGYVFVFFYTLYFQYASYAKKTGTISVNTFIAGILNIYLNYKFIPIYGYKAAAYTTVASYFMLFILHYCNSKYYLKANVIPLKIFFKDFIIFMTLSVLAFYLLKVENVVIAFGFKGSILMIALYIYLIRGNEEWIKNGLLKKFVKK